MTHHTNPKHIDIEIDSPTQIQFQGLVTVHEIKQYDKNSIQNQEKETQTKNQTYVKNT